VKVPDEVPRDVGLRPETMAVLREAMKAVVGEPGGTGGRARVPGIEICGKTGSAQVVAHGRLVRGVPQSMVPHGWFLCFAPADHPRIALVTMVENGGSGGEAAAPLAQKILAHFFHVEEAEAPAPPVAE
jgi:penicillin-binding protein 2